MAIPFLAVNFMKTLSHLRYAKRPPRQRLHSRLVTRNVASYFPRLDNRAREPFGRGVQCRPTGVSPALGKGNANVLPWFGGMQSSQNIRSPARAGFRQ
jgi:hypothetical protein